MRFVDNQTTPFDLWSSTTLATPSSDAEDNSTSFNALATQASQLTLGPRYRLVSMSLLICDFA